MKSISAKRLEAAGACEDQVRLFRDTFGDKPVKINAENWAKAGEVGLARYWLSCFLKGPVLLEYNRVCGAAHAEYERVAGPAWEDYMRARDAVGPAQEDYMRAISPAWEDYKQARDVALFEVLTKDS